MVMREDGNIESESSQEESSSNSEYESSSDYVRDEGDLLMVRKMTSAKGKLCSITIDGGNNVNVAGLRLEMLGSFKEFFPKDILQGLPPIKGIEHHIDFTLGATLPNKAAYRPTLKKVKKFNNKLVTLLRKVKSKKLLKDASLYVNIEKCTFCTNKVIFLGYVVGSQGVRVDEEKVKAIQSWVTSTSMSDMRSFHGMENSYRNFVKGYITIVAPLNEIIKRILGSSRKNPKKRPSKI
ncbi:Retrovirus-related Pol polyprotein from transposon opus, partial [Mucuna pruriens]